jgi:sec-independent protein translocase protein TatB
MFDVGLPEILVIIVVALLVVGPKDLPRVVRGFARAIARMRRMVDEFMGTVNDYVREAELQELKDAVEKTRKAMKGQGNFDDLLDDPTGPQRTIAPAAPPPAGEPTAAAAPPPAAAAPSAAPPSAVTEPAPPDKTGQGAP